MREEDLDEVLAIENASTPTPGRAATSPIRCAPATTAARGASTSELLGYFVLMAAANEAHLLNLSVAARHQRARARAARCCARRSSSRAGAARAACSSRCARATMRRRALYTRFGFRRIAVRRGYYPAHSRARGRAGLRARALMSRRRAQFSPRWALRRSGASRPAGCERDRTASRVDAARLSWVELKQARQPGCTQCGLHKTPHRRPCSASATRTRTGC